MDVSSAGSMQQMQMQMRKMDGSGGGQGQGGMRDIMQSLSTEDKNQMMEQLSVMSQEDRSKTVAQMKDIDATTLSEQDYTKALLEILNKANTNEVQTEGFSVYA